MPEPLFLTASDDEHRAANRRHITLSKPRCESAKSRSGQLQDELPRHAQAKVRTTIDEARQRGFGVRVVNLGASHSNADDGVWSGRALRR
jgi:hypothetical protein